MLKRFVIPLVFFVLILSCGTPGVRTGKMPEWVNSVDAVYSRARYVAATGFSPDRILAEKNALSNLTAFFGQTVEIDKTVSSYYKQTVSSGAADGWVDSAEMRTNIKTSASMDELMGVEIKEVWYDSRGTYYAVAVMEKARAILIYNDLIQANLNIINNLITMTPSEKNSLDGVIRYRFAAVTADVNVSYRNIIRLLDSEPPSGLLSGDHYRQEAQSIIRTIPISVRVTNDRATRIFNAFAGCLAEFGFESTSSASSNSRYVLNVNVTLSPVDLPDNRNIFSRIELAASLRDVNSGRVLVPYNFNRREGHTTQAEAENRCFLMAEKGINEEFAGLFSDFLSQIHPRN
ncbi:MAG: LPP20 family lipoprotein [Treponema sp.]|jgi:hypothetical protein|nr:LPP20 family lipoprotein [Treponema sp.]